MIGRPIMKSASSYPQQGRSALLLLALLVLIGLVVWGVSSRLSARSALREEASASAVIHVQTVKPETTAANAPLILPATVEAWSEAPILARTSGYLKRWLVDIGTPVKAGQLLAEIETPEVDAQLLQSQADLGTAKANLGLAVSTAARYRDLVANGLVSQQDADTRFAGEAVGKATVASGEANVSRLRQLAGFKRVVAPFDGVITARNTDVGALIASGSGTALFRIADLSRLRLYVQVPQAYAGSIKIGETATFTLAEHPGKTYKATVASTSNTLDSNNRTLLTQFTVENTGHELLAGSYAEVQIPPPPASAEAPAALHIPANALLFRSEGLQAVTVKDGKVLLKSIRIGRDLGATVEIAEGLSIDDVVVVNPPDSIIDGVAVEARPVQKPEVKADAKQPAKG